MEEDQNLFWSFSISKLVLNVDSFHLMECINLYFFVKTHVISTLCFLV